MRKRLNRQMTVLLGSLVLASACSTPKSAVLAPTVAEAQTGVLVGRVTSEDGAPLGGTEVRMSTTNNTIRTNADGTFRVTGLPSGLYYFGVRAPGYQPATDLLRYSPNDTLDVVLGRIEATKKLDTVQVQARADAGWEREMRRFASAIEAAPFATVLTEQDIAARRPIVTTDLFQGENGFTVVGGGGGAQVMGNRGKCAPALFLDGQFTRGMRVNDVTPGFIKVMLIFRGTSTIPAQFQDVRANPACGTIAIFTI